MNSKRLGMALAASLALHIGVPAAGVTAKNLAERYKDRIENVAERMKGCRSYSSLS